MRSNPIHISRRNSSCSSHPKEGVSCQDPFVIDLTAGLCLTSLAQAKQVSAARPVPLAPRLPIGAVPVAPTQRAAQRRVGGGQLEEVRRDGRLVRAAGAHLRHACRVPVLQNLLRCVCLLAASDNVAIQWLPRILRPTVLLKIAIISSCQPELG